MGATFDLWFGRLAVNWLGAWLQAWGRLAAAADKRGADARREGAA